MTRNIQVVAVCGSLASDSVTRVALQEALQAAQTAGAQTTFVDLREYDLPPFDADNQDAGDAPELRDHLRSVMRAVDAWPLPLDVAIPTSHEQVSDGALVEASLRDRVRRLGTEVVQYADVAQYRATATTTSTHTHAD